MQRNFTKTGFQIALFPFFFLSNKMNIMNLISTDQVGLLLIVVHYELFC